MNISNRKGQAPKPFAAATGLATWIVQWESRNDWKSWGVGSYPVEARTRIGAIRAWRKEGFCVAGYKVCGVKSRTKGTK